MVLAVLGYSLGQMLAGYAGDRRLASGVYIENGDTIGVAKGCGELVEQQLRARIAMRLEDDVNAPKATLARCRQSGANLGGMVAIVVDDRHTVGAALELEAAIDTGKVRESCTNLIGGNVETEANGDRGGRVTDVVLTGDV
jgi:hypothetical protein